MSSIFNQLNQNSIRTSVGSLTTNVDNFNVDRFANYIESKKMIIDVQINLFRKTTGEKYDNLVDILETMSDLEKSESKELIDFQILDELINKNIASATAIATVTDLQVKFAKEITKLINLLYKSIEFCVNSDNVSNYIKRSLLIYVPIRSGCLADNIMESLYIETRNGKDVTYAITTPEEYEHLHGRVKHYDEEGYGKRYTISNEYVYSRVVKIRDAGKKSAIYFLHDPIANIDILNDFLIITNETLDKLITKLLDRYIIKINLKIDKYNENIEYVSSVMDSFSTSGYFKYGEEAYNMFLKENNL